MGTPSESTIVAQATAAGRGALAVLRISGPHVASIRDTLTRPHRAGPWRSGATRRVDVWDAEGRFDDAVAVFAAAPHTYTGEDTLELTVHGNPLIVERALAACTALGARLAGPGEFTRRAVTAGKLDLLAAEGIDQLIRASTPAGVEVARHAVSGKLSGQVCHFRAVLIDTIAELEARLDYPADELALTGDQALVAGLVALAEECSELADSYRAGKLLVDGARVALVGPVNAGKSSLFNALLGHTRALVHEQAGTTRDVVEARTRIGSLEVTLLDTAGERQTDDPVEAAGLALARELVEAADLLIVVLRDGGRDPVERAILDRTEGRGRITISHAIDRAGASVAPRTLGVSSHTGAGLSELRQRIEAALLGPMPDRPAIASLRQADQLRQVAVAAREAVEALPLAGVAVAADILTEAAAQLDSLTGSDTREDVLDAVFARFCIGK